MDWVASCFEGASRGVVILWIPEWSSWSRWRRETTLYPGGSETVLMIFTGSLRGIYKPTKKEIQAGGYQRYVGKSMLYMGYQRYIYV